MKTNKVIIDVELHPLRFERLQEEPRNFPPDTPENIKFKAFYQQISEALEDIKTVTKHYHLTISGPTGKTAYFTFDSQDEVLRKYSELIIFVKDLSPSDKVTKERIGTTIFSSGVIVMWYNCIFDQYCLDRPKPEGDRHER